MRSAGARLTSATSVLVVATIVLALAGSGAAQAYETDQYSNRLVPIADDEQSAVIAAS